jgi:ribosome-associated protein
MINITPSISIDDSELQFDFIRSSGPGGQNVNKVATAVQLRFDAAHSPSLPNEAKARLVAIAGSRLTSEGVLLIEARRYRTQEQNRADAILRLVDLLQQAANPPRPRKKTRPSVASKARRLEEKKKHAEVKRLRHSGSKEFE